MQRKFSLLSVLTLVAVLLFPAGAMAQTNTGQPVTPCSVTGYSTGDSDAIKRQIRRLRRAGYRVDVTTAAGTKRVSDGPIVSRPSLMQARVPVSGC